MGKIKVLDKLLASKIAAGEVIERPASVLKELLENSIDAGAASISVTMAEGGKRLIRVADDGEGMSREDASVAFLRHATSKISVEEDLEAIRTMGFRGEALASISAVSRVVLKTRRQGDIAGVSVTIDGGTEPAVTDDGCPEGTTIEIKDLFYNTPARLKFLRSAEAEYSKALDVFRNTALINPHIRFRLVHGSKKILEAAPGSLKERIADLFGPDVIKNIVEVNGPGLKGYVGGHELTFQSAKGIHLFVNNRPVKDKSINHAVVEGYGGILDSRYPFAVIDLRVDPAEVDVNIHPAKSEVRFAKPRFVYDTVKTYLRASLSRLSPVSYGEAASKRPQAALERKVDYGIPVLTPAPLNEQPIRFQAQEEGVKSPYLLDLEFAGQLWGEFLIAQSNDKEEFYIIDQHGAAERCAFERLKEQFFGGTVKGQMLLLPERIETSPGERDSILGAMQYLKKMGFEVEPFGPSLKTGGETFIIKAVPDILGPRGASVLIRDLAEELNSVGASSRVEEALEGALMRIACHSVIRGPRTLTRQEAQALLAGLAKVDFAAYCPHGRPVIKKFTRAEIETMFKR